MPFEMFGQSLSSNMQNVVKQPIPYFLETTMAYILINGLFYLFIYLFSNNFH